MKTNGANLINKAFKAFRKNPCAEARHRLSMVILAQADCDSEREIVFPIVIFILSGMSVAEVHSMLVSAASRTGVDMETLSGGITPRD